MLAFIVGTALIAYLLGSIPFGFLLAKGFGLGDIRKTGSGNIGATNIMRSGHKLLALATLLLDAGKGFIAVYVANDLYFDSTATIAGLFAVLGHVFPCWLHFKGGKGVATTIGVLFALNWMLGICVCFLWGSVFMITRLSSLASLFAVGYSGIVAYVLDDYLTALLCLNLAALVMLTHRDNIQRLLVGKEPSFRKGSS